MVTAISIEITNLYLEFGGTTRYMIKSVDAVRREERRERR